MNDFSNFISTVGFPIAASVALFWLNMKTSETYSKALEDMRRTVEKNTDMLATLIHQLRKED